VKSVRIGLVLFTPLPAMGRLSPPGPPQILDRERESASQRLLWKSPGAGPFPAILFNHGCGGADPMETAGMPMREAAEKIASAFLDIDTRFFIPAAGATGSLPIRASSCQMS